MKCYCIFFLNCTNRIFLESQPLVRQIRHLFPKHKCRLINPEMLQVKDGQKDRQKTPGRGQRREDGEIAKWEHVFCCTDGKEGNHVLLSLTPSTGKHTLDKLLDQLCMQRNLTKTAMICSKWNINKNFCAKTHTLGHVTVLWVVFLLIYVKYFTAKSDQINYSHNNDPAKTDSGKTIHLNISHLLQTIYCAAHKTLSKSTKPVVLSRRHQCSLSFTTGN